VHGGSLKAIATKFTEEHGELIAARRYWYRGSRSRRSQGCEILGREPRLMHVRQGAVDLVLGDHRRENDSIRIARPSSV
ncbi:MAG TPA: hypothetical protein VFF69_01110, partial [Phycisphaerales bacterium]|nr:hypothetical protein [Phycisphaerales bacterium]